MTVRMFRVAGAAAALALGACSLPQPRSTVQTTFTLRPAPAASAPAPSAPAASAPAASATAAPRTVVRVLPIEPAPGLDGPAMLYSPEPGQLLAYRDSRWLAPPAELIRSALARALARQPWVAAVEQDAPLTGGALVLQCGLDRLEHDVDTRPGRVRLDLRCQLGRGGEIVDSWFAGGTTAPPHDDAAGYAAAAQSLLDAATASVVAHVGAAAEHPEGR